MAEYIDFDVEKDPDVLAEDGFNYLRSKVEGWEPSAGHLETWLIEAIARMASEVADVTSQVPTTIFRYFGANIVNIPPVDAAPAVGLTTWVMNDNAGYTIAAGTLVGKRVTGDQVETFATAEEYVIEPGTTSTPSGAISVIAVEPGVAGNGLTGALDVLDALDFVSSVTLAGLTTGGTDAETDAVYLDRLTTQLRLLAPRPILPEDFAAMALNIPGISRALAIDGYDPATDTFDNERTVAVVVMDALGNPAGTTLKQDVRDYLEANREVNFIVNVIDPTYTTIDVTYTVMAFPDFDPADVQSRVNSALSNFLDPNNWGVPPIGDQRTWTNETIVRYLEIAAVINAVEGVNYVQDVSFGPTGGAQEANDMTLAGRAPLPRPGSILGTVNIP